jgi:ATP-dependent DNA ligase
MKADGLEGVILKDPMSPYIGGNRRYWKKLKHEDTADGFIVGYQDGKGKYAGMVGAVLIGQYRNGEVVQVTKISGMEDAVRAKLSPRDIGKVVEFEFTERTDKSYRHPRWFRWRPDKKKSDCVW